MSARAPATSGTMTAVHHSRPPLTGGPALSVGVVRRVSARRSSVDVTPESALVVSKKSAQVKSRAHSARHIEKDSGTASIPNSVSERRENKSRDSEESVKEYVSSRQVSLSARGRLRWWFRTWRFWTDASRPAERAPTRRPNNSDRLGASGPSVGQIAAGVATFAEPTGTTAAAREACHRAPDASVRLDTGFSNGGPVVTFSGGTAPGDDRAASGWTLRDRHADRGRDARREPRLPGAAVAQPGCDRRCVPIHRRSALRAVSR